MTNLSLAYSCGGAEYDLTPLGERRRKLPLQRKVKQLERPWKAVNPKAVEPHAETWAPYQQGNTDLLRVGVRPRSGAPACRNRSGNTKGSNRRMRNSASASSGMSPGRKRPSTVPTPSSSGLRRQRNWGNRMALPVDPTWNGSDCVGWDVTGARIRGVRGRPKQAHIAAVHGCGYGQGSPGSEGNGHAELVGNQVVRTVVDAALSLVSSHSFATSSAITTGAAEDNVCRDGVDPTHKASKIVDPTSGHCRKNNNTNNTSNTNNTNNKGDEEDSFNNKSNVPLGSTDQVGLSVRVGSGAVVKRPNSAGLSTARGAYPLILNGDKVIRPRTAGPSSQGRAGLPRFASGESRLNERGKTPTSGRPGPEKGGCSMTSWTDEAPDAGSSLECRTSVSVVLPSLEEANDTGDKRFLPGSAQEFSSRCESEAGPESPGKAESLVVVDVGDAQSKAKSNSQAYSQESWERGDGNAGQRARGVQNGSTLLGTRAPHIGALGYFVGDSRQPVMQAKAALHGRALVGNHYPRPSTSRRSLPSSPALTPGEQPYGVAHPLSPTSMGSPPRRHRNSNWGEEEEKENSRKTVPFIVSGTLLGWKLSTRERKKSLEDSLKNSNYSEHHLIPVYGFRRGNEVHNESEVGGGEGSNGGSRSTTAAEERGMELRRLEARALAAERMSLERRARAEGGAGGAAFARAMRRRATDRAEWIQKMGDIHDIRKENVLRGSSPEELSAYCKRVRHRLHGERMRRRTARGLPLRRPQRISAITSRADFPSACRKCNNLTTMDNNERGKRDERDAAGGGDGDGLIQDELRREPYLMLVRAKTKSSQEGGTAHGTRDTSVVVGPSVQFCSECLGCCQGACSSGGTDVVGREYRRHIIKPEHQWQQNTTGKMKQQRQQPAGALW